VPGSVGKLDDPSRQRRVGTHGVRDLVAVDTILAAQVDDGQRNTRRRRQLAGRFQLVEARVGADHGGATWIKGCARTWIGERPGAAVRSRASGGPRSRATGLEIYPLTECQPETLGGDPLRTDLNYLCDDGFPPTLRSRAQRSRLAAGNRDSACGMLRSWL